MLWFVGGAALLFAIGMYGVAEALAARVPRPEEYIARVPAIAIVPWFLAGSLFPISALPIGLEWIARFLPLTHALALVRYGLLGDPSGLEHIWRMSSAGEMAALSLAAVGLFARWRWPAGSARSGAAPCSDALYMTPSAGNRGSASRQERSASAAPRSPVNRACHGSGWRSTCSSAWIANRPSALQPDLVPVRANSVSSA